MKKFAVVCSVLLAVIFAFVSCGNGAEKKAENGKEEKNAPDAAPAEEIYNVPVVTSIYRGPEDAPVTIINFSDFQCPFSKRSVDLMESVMKRYNGKVRYVFKHYPLSFHKFAKPASMAAAAAQNQGKFWEYYAKLYSDVKNVNEDTIVAYAKDLKLDMDKFNADRTSAETAKKIQEDISLGAQFGVRGTPTLFINGIRIVGANSAKIEDTIIKQIVIGEQLKAKGAKNPYLEIVKNGQTKFIPPKRETPAVSQDIYNVPVPAAAPVWGAEDALVTIVLFDDFECPFCSRLYATYEQLKKDYDGKIRIAFVNLPLGFHKKAREAAIVASAAKNQGKFWEMYSFLFTRQKEWAHSQDLKAWLESVNKDLPADWEQLQKDMKGKTAAAVVDADVEFAGKLGLRGTPASFINGRFISGALPIDAFKKVIDEEIKKAEARGLKGDALYNDIIKNGRPEIVKNANKGEKEDLNKIYDIKLTGKEAVKGADKAKVTIVEFSDFQCPFCSKAYSTINEVAENYKKDVRIVYKNLPLGMHQQALPAAVFARAVKNIYGDEKFFQAASKLYSNQNSWKSDHMAKFESYAEEIGCDWNKVKAEMAKSETEAEVKADIVEAGSHNIRSVPMFFVNGKKVSGAKPKDYFESMIESILKENK